MVVSSARRRVLRWTRSARSTAWEQTAAPRSYVSCSVSPLKARRMTTPLTTSPTRRTSRASPEIHQPSIRRRDFLPAFPMGNEADDRLLGVVRAGRTRSPSIYEGDTSTRVRCDLLRVALVLDLSRASPSRCSIPQRAFLPGGRCCPCPLASRCSGNDRPGCRARAQHRMQDQRRSDRNRRRELSRPGTWPSADPSPGGWPPPPMRCLG